ncbi:MAG TPA: MotA/TolQ/ExbB proton channel family protein [Fibrobacteria bacterium]|nr:MotA/TolQ/ExbB proton channel family protein [Fibrobacteria bacterium]
MISLSTVCGVVFGFLVIAMGILHETKDWQVFLSLGSLAIVFGGTVTVTFIGFRFQYVWNAFMATLKIFVKQDISSKSLVQDVKTAVEWSKKIQAEGQNGYASIAKGSKDEFTRYIFTLASTGYKPDDIREFGTTNIEEHYFRHLQGSTILTSMGSMTPAFGLVGTLLGLIVMLGKLEDPSKLGPGLSLALTATLYGLLFARFVFMPSSTKVKQTLSIERFRHYLILEALVLIMEKKQAMYIQDKLNSYLDRKEQYSMFGDKGGAAKKGK